MASLLSNERYSLYYQRINLIYQRPEVKASLEVILSVFTVAVLILAAIRPTLTNIASLQKKIEDLTTVDQQADTKITQLFAAQNQLNQFKEQLPLYDQAVPDTFSYFDIVGRIEVLARNRNVTIQTAAIPGTRLFGTGTGTGEWAQKQIRTDANGIMQTTVDFTAVGNPANVRDFLSDLEKIDRVVFINSLSFQTEQVGGQAQRLRVTGEVYFYFYHET